MHRSDAAHPVGSAVLVIQLDYCFARAECSSEAELRILNMSDTNYPRPQPSDCPSSSTRAPSMRVQWHGHFLCRASICYA